MRAAKNSAPKRHVRNVIEMRVWVKLELPTSGLFTQLCRSTQKATRGAIFFSIEDCNGPYHGFPRHLDGEVKRPEITVFVWESDSK